MDLCERVKNFGPGFSFPRAWYAAGKPLKSGVAGMGLFADRRVDGGERSAERGRGLILRRNIFDGISHISGTIGVIYEIN